MSGRGRALHERSVRADHAEGARARGGCERRDDEVLEEVAMQYAAIEFMPITTSGKAQRR